MLDACCLGLDLQPKARLSAHGNLSGKSPVNAAGSPAIGDGAARDESCALRRHNKWLGCVSCPMEQVVVATQRTAWE